MGDDEIRPQKVIPAAVKAMVVDTLGGRIQSGVLGGPPPARQDTAHAAICFMALILHRVMRGRLRAAHTGLTPERVGATPPHSASPRSSQWRPTRIRGVFKPGMLKRGTSCPPGEKASHVAAIDAVVVEHFDIAISDINKLQD